MSAHLWRFISILSSGPCLGGHPRRHPGPGVVLARSHERLGADPPGQGRHADWTLSRIVWVADRRFFSAETRRYLREGDHHYIIGEKLRSGFAEATAALSRPGRYQDVAGSGSRRRLPRSARPG